MPLRSAIVISIWFVCNIAAIGFLAFSDIIVLRVVSWVYLSIAISVAGLVEIGGLFGSSSSDSKASKS